MVSAVNLAKEYSNQITVNIENKSGNEIKFTTSESFISAHLDTKFTCENSGCEYDETGKIKKITFKEKS